MHISSNDPCDSFIASIYYYVGNEGIGYIKSRYQYNNMLIIMLTSYIIIEFLFYLCNKAIYVHFMYFIDLVPLISIHHP